MSKSFRTNPVFHSFPIFNGLGIFSHLVHRDLQNGASSVEDFGTQWLQHCRGSCGLPGILSVVDVGMGDVG